MNKFPLKLIVYAFLLVLLVLLDLFTNFDHKTLVSVAIILTFLIIFTYVFKTDSSKGLKVGIILFTFIGLPLFILIYLGVFSSLPGIWGGILTVIFTILSIVAIIELEYVEIEYLGD